MFLHAHVQCVSIVMTKYQMAPAKPVVGVDRPVLGTTMEPMLKTMHKKCMRSQSCKFVKNYFSKKIFLHAHVQCVCIVMTKYKMAPAKTVVEVDRPV